MSTQRDGPRHIPVLASTVLDLLSPSPGESVLDVTLGLGGHAALLLERTAPDGRYVGLDADADNLAVARERLSPWTERLDLLHANFVDLASLSLPPVDILLADLGLSSPHIDDPTKGFTFRADAPLDMRFDRTSGQTAAERIASIVDEEELTSIFSRYGELEKSRTLARRLMAAPPATTADVRAAAEEVYRWRAPSVLPQIFQALRVWTNEEMAALEALLEHGPGLLKSGGRMAVISYHSLEDRLVKRTFRSLTEAEKDPVTGKRLAAPPYELLTRKPVRPSQEEIRDNPRSRSALLRIIRRSGS